MSDANLADVQAGHTKMQISDTDVAIEINGMDKWYGDFHVLRDINLRLCAASELLSVVHPGPVSPR